LHSIFQGYFLELAFLRASKAILAYSLLSLPLLPLLWQKSNSPVGGGGPTLTVLEKGPTIHFPKSYYHGSFPILAVSTKLEHGWDSVSQCYY
jgi:hypothetical protein